VATRFKVFLKNDLVAFQLPLCQILNRNDLEVPDQAIGLKKTIIFVSS